MDNKTWINIKKRKPNENGFYLVTIESKYFSDDTTIRSVSIKPFNKEINKFWNLSSDLEWKSEVIAWQKMPEEYTSNDNEIKRETLCNEQLEATVSELRAQVEALSKCCTQRGARMQIMREWMNSSRGIGPPTEWWYFVEEMPKAAGWFDPDGVPVGEEDK